MNNNELAHDRKQLQSFHLFAGAGGGILADLLLGHKVVGACEIEEYPRKILLQRQRDGILPKFPIWDDITTFDGRPWKGHVEIVAGGFPCQDISAAGKGAGIEGKRSGLWGEMARVIGEIQPRFVFVENSPLLVGRGLAVVLGDLAEMGYDARWCLLGADDAGAPHRRKRIWLLASLADPDRTAATRWSGGQSEKPERGNDGAPIRDALRIRLSTAVSIDGGSQSRESDKTIGRSNREIAKMGSGGDCGAPQSWWTTEPELGRVADGVACRVDRLKAIGNGQVPHVAALAWEILTSEP